MTGVNNRSVLMHQNVNDAEPDDKPPKDFDISHNNNNEEMNDSVDELEKLQAQIQQEEQLKHALEQSYQELLATSKELEKRMNLIDDESNEWKTRFENQEETNRQLAKQIKLLDSKVDELKDKAKQAKNHTLPFDERENDPQFIANLEKEKQSLINQLRDYEWRLEQENKAYHKANEERKELHTEINDTRNAINAIKERNDLQQYQMSTMSMVINASNTNLNGTNPLTSRRENNTSRNSNSEYYYPNIPMDKRVIDPRKGPIDKKAAVRVLPKIETNNME